MSRPAVPSATTIFDSILFRDAFGKPRMREIFSDYALIGRYAASRSRWPAPRRGAG